MDLRLIFGGLVNLPTVVWVVALILSIVLIRRGASNAKRLLIMGSCLMLLSIVVKDMGQALADYDFRHGSSPGAVLSIIVNGSQLISIPGIICLFYAVWTKFKESNGIAIHPQKEDGTSNSASN